MAIHSYGWERSRFDEKGRDTAFLNTQHRENFLQVERVNDDNKRQIINLAEAVKFEAFPDKCVVYFANSMECLLGVQDFNSSVLLYIENEIDHNRKAYNSAAIEEIRKSILHHLILKKADEESFQNEVYGADQRLDWVDQAEVQENKHIEKKIRAIGDSALRGLYMKYSRFFDTKIERKFLTIASTDSNFVRSIRDSIQGKIDKKGSRKRISLNELINTKVNGQSIPWFRRSRDSLPLEIRNLSDSMAVGELSRLLSASYGSFLLYLVDENVIPKINFENAIFPLIALKLGPVVDSIKIDSQVNAFYLKNKNSLLTPDTGLFHFWLIPNWNQSQAGLGSNIMKNEVLLEKIRSDTSVFRGKILLDKKLPKSVQSKVADLIKERNKNLIGPIYSQEGKIYLRLLKVFSGGNSASIQSVKPEIFSRLGLKAVDDEIAQLIAKGQSKRRELRISFINEAILDETTRKIGASNAESSFQKNRVAAEEQIRNREFGWIMEKVRVNKTYFSNAF